MTKVRGILRLVHVTTSLVVALLVVFGGLGGASALPVAAAVAAALFGTASGFAMNEVLDLRIDQQIKPYRPIPSGQISRRSAIVTFAVAYALGWASAIACAALDPSGAIMILFMIVGTGYTPIKNRWGLTKEVYAATSFSLPLLFGLVYSDRLDDEWMLLAALFCFTLYRELVMDIADLPGDSSAGVRTIAFYIGEGATTAVGVSFWSIAVILIPSGPLTTWQFWLWLAVLMVSLMQLLNGISPRDHPGWRRLTIMMWMPMVGFSFLLL